MIYVMDLVNVSLIYVTEEKKTHGKTSYTLDYEMAHMGERATFCNLESHDIWYFFHFSLKLLRLPNKRIVY